jgi:Cu+-exporting ATPase
LTKDLAAKGGSKMPPEMVEDPVCGMRIDPDDAAGTAEYGGKLYYFCSETCHDAFVANPATYV